MPVAGREGVMKLMNISFCCSCGKVRDEARAGVSPDTWIDLHAYMTKHGLRHGDFLFKYTYCLECARVIQKVTVEGTESHAGPRPSGLLGTGHGQDCTPLG